jgi:hypothetical protein
VTDKAQQTATADAKNTAIQIVDLADIEHTLIKRGREAYRNEELETTLASLKVGQAIVWQEATVPQGLSDKAQTAFRGKMRNRLVSCAKAVSVEVSVTWNNQNKMIIIKKA